MNCFAWHSRFFIWANLGDLRIFAMKLVAGGQSCHKVIYYASSISHFIFHRFIFNQFLQTKSLKDKMANLWSSINHLVAGLPTSNYLHREKDQFPLFSLKWKNKNNGAKNIQFQNPPCGHFLIFTELCLYDQSPTLSSLAFSYCSCKPYGGIM